MKPKNENKIILKQWVQVFILIVVIFMFATSIGMILKAVNPESLPAKELYSYDTSSKSDYKVYLKKNNFFTSEYLGMNKQYITSLIDHISINPKYNFKASKDIEYTYTYRIIGKLTGEYAEADGKKVEVWSKEYTLSQPETKTGTGKTIVVDRNIDINYNEYNQIMADFRNQFGLTVDSTFDVIFNIEIEGGLPGQEKTLKQSDNISYKIPLLNQTTIIKPNYQGSTHEPIYASTHQHGKTDITKLIIGILLALLSIYLFIKFGKQLLNTTKKSEYILSLNKILKEYGDIIAEADNMPDMTKYDIVNIKLFRDIVDIEEELHSPIIYVEIRENLECWFLIFYNQTAYRYVLKYEDLDHFSR